MKRESRRLLTAPQSSLLLKHRLSVRYATSNRPGTRRRAPSCDGIPRYLSPFSRAATTSEPASTSAAAASKSGDESGNLGSSPPPRRPNRLVTERYPGTSRRCTEGLPGGCLVSQVYRLYLSFRDHSHIQRHYAELQRVRPFTLSVPKLRADIQDDKRPCSFIAICNILILRGQIEILPPNRRSVSYEFLAQLVGEHILLTAPDLDVSAALSMMPLTTSKSQPASSRSLS